MIKQAIVAFFKPSLPIIIVMGMFLGISIPAQFQRWGMDEQIMGVPKPPFYDELQPFPFRLVYAWLMIPAAFVGVWGWALSIPLPIQLFTPAGAILHVVYFYILACFVGLLWRYIKDDEGWHLRTQSTRPN
jgi:hypothetical protein